MTLVEELIEALTACKAQLEEDGHGAGIRENTCEKCKAVVEAEMVLKRANDEAA